MLRIVLDAMGADNGIAPVVDGLLSSLENKNFHALLVGDELLLKPFVDSKHLPNAILQRIQIVHTNDFMQMTESASIANKRVDTSIYQAIQLLKKGEADACVSAGHSGATMSLATLQIGRIPGVSRPAICTCMPTITSNPSIILDAGANTDCKPEYLLDFAIMGFHYAKKVLGYSSPRVGLLSNGEEDSKGNELTKEAFKMLKHYDFFKGNVEGSDIFNGSVDVIVCDGFMGNLVLKASEGVASSIGIILKEQVRKSFFSMFGYLFMKQAFSSLKKKIDYAEYGGAPLLGVKKPVIVSHGKSNARAIECAIYQAVVGCELWYATSFRKLLIKINKASLSRSKCYASISKQGISMSVYASMKSIASYVPSRCVPNKFFTSFLETSDEWIVQRTGINTRYFAPSHLKSSDLGVEAAKLAIKRANLSSSDIDIILCASISPDFFGMPSTACIIASKLGMKDIPAFDITAACSGFVYCLSMAKSYIESGAYNNVLVVGAEKISSILDFTDRSTCVLFGDGAGACVIGQGDKVGIKDVHISSNGDFSHLLYTPKSNNMPNNFQSDISILDGIIEEKETENQFLRMKGNEVFKVAVRTISKDAKYMLQKHNILPNELDYFVPHQANLRIIQAIANSLELPDEKIVLTVQKYGNTSAASIPMALDFAYTHGMFKNRDLLLLDAFGAGFTWGSALVYADFAD